MELSMWLMVKPSWKSLTATNLIYQIRLTSLKVESSMPWMGSRHKLLELKKATNKVLPLKITILEKVMANAR